MASPAAKRLLIKRLQGKFVFPDGTTSDQTKVFLKTLVQLEERDLEAFFYAQDTYVDPQATVEDLENLAQGIRDLLKQDGDREIPADFTPMPPEKTAAPIGFSLTDN